MPWLKCRSDYYTGLPLNGPFVAPLYLTPFLDFLSTFFSFLSTFVSASPLKSCDGKHG